MNRDEILKEIDHLHSEIGYMGIDSIPDGYSGQQALNILTDRIKQIPIHIAIGRATVDINTQVEILKKVINKLMITFDNEGDRVDYILDICNEYRKESENHYH